MNPAQSGRGGAEGEGGRYWLEVKDTEAAAVLTDLDEQRFLRPFLGRERTVKTAAEELGVPPAAMLYRVRRMHRLGLLTVTRLEARHGRAIKHYRTSADEFFVPEPYLRGGAAEALLENIEAYWQRHFIPNLVAARQDHDPTGVWGIRVYRGADDKVYTESGPGPGRSFDELEPEAPAIEYSWVLMRLDFEDAKALQREMVELTQRYASRGGGQLYLSRLGLTPVKEHPNSSPR